MSRSGIYGIKNTANGKWYVGQSNNLDTRKRDHFWALRNKRHYNSHLQSTFNEYGEDSFEWHVIEECAEEMLDNRETAWITYYNSNDPEYGYNVESGGKKNKCMSAETRKKISQAKLGKKRSEETKEKLRQRICSKETREKLRQASLGNKNRLGSNPTEETKEKIRRALLGHMPTVETREKLRKAHLGRNNHFFGKKHTEETKEKLRLYYQKRRQKRDS